MKQKKAALRAENRMLREFIWYLVEAIDYMTKPPPSAPAVVTDKPFTLAMPLQGHAKC